MRTLLGLPLPLPLLLLIHTSLATALPLPLTQQPEVDSDDNNAADDDFFTEFTSPREGATLVTGSTVEVRWRTGGEAESVIMEVAEGAERLSHFVQVDYDIDFSRGAHNWTIPERLEPGPYALRLADSSDPSVYADSPIFAVIHAAPAPTPAPAPPRRGDGSAALSQADIIGLAIGLGIAAVLVVCGVWLWRRNRGKWGGSGGSGRRETRGDGGAEGGDSTGEDGFASMSGVAVVDKLPEGVVSAWGPEGALAPVELPAEVYVRGDEGEPSGRAREVSSRGGDTDLGSGDTAVERGGMGLRTEDVSSRGGTAADRWGWNMDSREEWDGGLGDIHTSRRDTSLWTGDVMAKSEIAHLGAGDTTLGGRIHTWREHASLAGGDVMGPGIEHTGLQGDATSLARSPTPK